MKFVKWDRGNRGIIKNREKYSTHHELIEYPCVNY